MPCWQSKGLKFHNPAYGILTALVDKKVTLGEACLWVNLALQVIQTKASLLFTYPRITTDLKLVSDGVPTLHIRPIFLYNLGW